MGMMWKDGIGEQPLSSGSGDRLLRRAAQVAACSVYLLDRAAAIDSSIGAKGHVIYNAVEFQSRPWLGFPVQDVIAVGRLVPIKGFDVLLADCQLP